MKWEYQFEDFNTYGYVASNKNITEAINDYGKDGWEAVGIAINKNEWTRVLFKRKIK